MKYVLAFRQRGDEKIHAIGSNHQGALMVVVSSFETPPINFSFVLAKVEGTIVQRWQLDTKEGAMPFMNAAWRFLADVWCNMDLHPDLRKLSMQPDEIPESEPHSDQSGNEWNA